MVIGQINIYLFYLIFYVNIYFKRKLRDYLAMISPLKINENIVTIYMVKHRNDAYK